MAYDGTEYEVPISRSSAIPTTRPDHRTRKGDKGDHAARKAAYAALKGPHESRREWRHDFDSLKRLSKYSAKHFGDYRYVAKVMAYRRMDDLAYGRGYDPYFHGDRFAKPVIVEKARAADALEDTEILPEDLGSLRDDEYEYSLPHSLWIAADDLRYLVAKKVGENLCHTVTLMVWHTWKLAIDGFLSEEAFLGTKAQKKNAEQLLVVVKDAKKQYTEDEWEAIDLLDEAADILKEVIAIIP